MGLNRATFFCIFALSLFGRATPFAKGGGSPAPDNRAPIIVAVRRHNGHLTVTLQSNPALNQDALRGLQLMFHERGPDYPVAALIDQADLRSGDFSIVPALAGKAQLANVHTFLVDYKRGVMGEVHFCPDQPISAAPKLSSECAR